MFAKIIPLLRLPRRFGAFDYRLPDDQTFEVGDVVKMTFHRRNVLGVIESIESFSNEKKLVTIANAAPIFNVSIDHLLVLKQIASELGQSISSIASVAFDGLADEVVSIKSFTNFIKFQPTIDKNTIENVKMILEECRAGERSELSVGIDDETALVLAHALCQTSKKQTLIVVPRIRDAERFAAIVAKYSPMILIGTTKRYQRNAIIRSWRNGSCRVLIGTRQATMIEPNDLENVLVFQAACDDHGSVMRNPHIDAVRSAKLLAKSSKANIILTDVLPPITSERMISDLKQNGSLPIVIDVTHKGENSHYPLLSQTLLEAIKIALQSQKKVLLSFNRKGVAKRIECKACGHVPFCGTCGNLPTVRLDDLLCEACGSEMWKPTICEACHSPKIGLKSIGGASIAAHLAKAFPTAIIGTVQKGDINLKADIIIATEYFFSSVFDPFHDYGFGVVAEILADVGFAPGDYRGSENTARKIARLKAIADREKAECIIQTVARDRLMTLISSDYVVKSELTIRQKYQLPPFGVIVNFNKATINQLPEEIRLKCKTRGDKITAKIDQATFKHWQTIFPMIPDSVDIRIEQ